MAEEEFVTICVACTKGITRENMQYVNGRVFHPECYEKYGKNFLVVDQDLARKTRRLKIELVELKNLKVRNEGASGVKAPSKLERIKSTKTKKRKIKKTKVEVKRKTAKNRMKKRTKIKKQYRKKTKSSKKARRRR